MSVSINKVVSKKETTESSGISGVGTNSSITPNNMQSSDKSTPTMTSQQPTSPPSTHSSLAPQNTGIQQSDEISESKTMDEVSDKVKVHPSITSDMDNNIQSLKELKTIGFHGPNCHNASLMALGLEFTLFDNHEELINGFIDNFTDKTEITGKTDDLKSIPPNLKKGDIFVIKNSGTDQTAHTFIYAGNDTFFQKNNQDPGEFYTSDLKGALQKWLEPKDSNYHFTFTVHRPNIQKLASKNTSVSQPMSELKKTELEFGSLLEESWNEAVEIKNKNESLKNVKYKESFYPTPKTVVAVTRMKELVDNLGKIINNAKKDYDTMDPDDQKRFKFIEDQHQALCNQLKSMVGSMKDPVMDNKGIPSKSEWRESFRFISNTTNNWF